LLDPKGLSVTILFNFILRVTSVTVWSRFVYNSRQAFGKSGPSQHVGQTIESGYIQRVNDRSQDETTHGKNLRIEGREGSEKQSNPDGDHARNVLPHFIT